MRFLLFCALVVHSDDFKKSQRFCSSELFISGPEIVQLVFYYPMEGMEKDDDALKYLIGKYPIRAPTRDECTMFLELYGLKDIAKEASRLKLRFENLRFVIVVNVKVAVHKPP